MNLQPVQPLPLQGKLHHFLLLLNGWSVCELDYINTTLTGWGGGRSHCDGGGDTQGWGDVEMFMFRRVAQTGSWNLRVSERERARGREIFWRRLILTKYQRTESQQWKPISISFFFSIMWSCITDFFTYETTKSVVVKSWTIGIINRIVQLLIITYFIGWVQANSRTSEKRRL